LAPVQRLAKLAAMSKTTASPPVFLLTLFDRAQWCPVLQARFEVADLDQLRLLLGTDSDGDINLNWIYRLDDAGAAKIAEAFGIAIDWAALDFSDREFIVDRINPIQQAPYLIHTGYELPLLLDGRKKLARMMEPYPPLSFEGEDRFDHGVAAGQLHKEVEIEPFKDGTTHRLGWQGTRKVYYTAKGEEWRIPAMRLLLEAAAWAGWNEHFERIEGMLFGYEDWQNNWWIETGLSGGGFAGMRLCCTVDAKGLAWIEQAGYRALPPIDHAELRLDFYDEYAISPDRLAQHGTRDVAAIAVFSVGGKGALSLFGENGAPWQLPAAKIPELNRLLLRAITIKPLHAASSEQ
jgi:hypothetical protein